MKRATFCLRDNVTGILILPAFIMERNAKILSRGQFKKKKVLVFPSKFMDPQILSL